MRRRVIPSIWLFAITAAWGIVSATCNIQATGHQAWLFWLVLALICTAYAIGALEDRQ